MLDPGDIDPREVLASLGFDRVDAVEPLIGGMDSQLWRFEAGSTLVLRMLRREQAEVADKEAAVMRMLHARGYPVPKVHLHGIWRQRPVLVIDWAEGTTFSAALKRHSWRAWWLGERFGRTQARLHALRPPIEALPTALHSPQRSWIDWSHHEEHALRAALSALPSQPRALLHLDFHPMNVLTDPRQVTAVLDWDNVQLGDPRADLARTESILLLTPLQGLERQAAQRLFVAGWRRGYRALRGPPGDMALFRAWAGAAMLADLLPHRDTRGFPSEFFDDATRWMHRWKRVGGVA